ncbi:MAG: hypothetical protein AAF331_12520 [Pseudomonadota bacterium]
MSVFQSHISIAVLVALASLGIQVGFAIGVFGPAWLSPVLSLPALCLLAWLWRRAEKQKETSQAFTSLVI